MIHRRLTLWGIAAALGAAALAPEAAAQGSGEGFLFRQPRATLSVRGGLAHALAASDIFSETDRHFMKPGGGDLSYTSPAVEGELGIVLRPRLHLALGGAYLATQQRSEYRDFEDNDDRPIEQTTQYVRVPVTAGLKAYLAPPGETVGTFAWVPARYAPYVGAGGGGMWYRFRQHGDFINMQNFVVSGDDLESHGWTPTAHAFAGVDYSLSPRIALTAEGRYVWAETELNPFAFEGFEPIDLSGVSATVGFQLRL